VSAFRYPVTLDLEGRPCLVVGGGAVALRKVVGLLEAEARVTVVSPTLSTGLLELARAGRFQWRPREFLPGDTEACFLVVVATGDRSVNRLVTEAARRSRTLVNCADDPGHCDFILPALVRRGSLIVAVSTGGASPAMACMVRDELDAKLTEDYARLAEVAANVRRRLRERGLAVGGDCWAHALDEIKQLVAAGRPHEAEQRLEERLGG
jgi:precorrin-2 dehydrogenase/sirohydrochlorin ferrochelatase